MHHNAAPCKTIDEISIGDRVSVTYQVTDEDLRKFAEISGDWNPVHFDDVYAANTIFGQRIAHGTISVAKFSGLFGMRLPGLGTLWQEQTIKFIAPVLLNKRYSAIAEVVEKQKRSVVFDTWVEDEDGARVIEGRGSVIPISERTRRRIVS